MQELDNVIFVGDKPFMNYVTAIIMQFTTHSREEVIIKARGKHISTAVDVAEMVLKQYLPEKIEVDALNTNSKLVRNKEGREVRVSSIEIVLKRS